MKINTGSTIGIFSSSYGIIHDTPESAKRAEDFLRDNGFAVRHGKLWGHKRAFCTGTPQERADEFNSLLHDPEVDILMASVGGIVTNSMLPYIDYDSLAARPKILCSYSDSTSVLNAVTSMTGLTTFYGMSPRTFANLTDYNLRSFERTLASGGVEHEKSGPWTVISPGRGEGRLTGGYLVNYAALFASPYFTPPEDKRMLFIEDHELELQFAVGETGHIHVNYPLVNVMLHHGQGILHFP